MLVDFKKRPQKEVGWYKVRWSWWPVATLHTAVTEDSPAESHGGFAVRAVAPFCWNQQSR